MFRSKITTGKNKRKSCIPTTPPNAQHLPITSLLFRIKVRVRRQANNHNKEAISSQRQTRFAEHISPPLAALHLGAPGRMPRALCVCWRAGLVIIRGAVVVFVVIAFHEALVVRGVGVADFVVEEAG
jgi:hypothetical protein